MPPTDAFGGHCQIYNCREANHNEHQPASVNIYFALKQVYQFTDTVSNWPALQKKMLLAGAFEGHCQNIVDKTLLLFFFTSFIFMTLNIPKVM